MKGRLLYFILNVLIFLFILCSAKGESGGDIFLIISYATLTIFQIVFCLIFTKDKENVLEIIIGIVVCFILFKIINNQQSKQETKFIRETMKIN